jgi:hypothetical protein
MGSYRTKEGPGTARAPGPDCEVPGQRSAGAVSGERVHGLNRLNIDDRRAILRGSRLTVLGNRYGTGHGADNQGNGSKDT